MKNSIKRIWALLLCACMLAGAVNLTWADEAEAAEVYPTAISFEESSFTMQKTGQVQGPFAVRIEPEGAEAEITWSTDDTSILKVFTAGASTGQIQGMSEGTTNLVATVHGKNGEEISARLPVTVIDTAMRVYLQNPSPAQTEFWQWADYGVEYTIPECPFTAKTGYRLKGWNTKSDGTGTWYKDQGKITVEKGTSGNGLYLYAKWEPITHTITYIDAGDDPNAAYGYNPTSYTIEDSLHFVATYRYGYTQTAWIINGDPNNIIDLSDLTASYGKGYFQEDLVLTAVWEADVYHLSFQPNSGTGTMEDLTGYLWETKEIPECGFVREGYQFDGWRTYTSPGSPASATETLYPGDLFSFERCLSPDGGTTPGITSVYAGWKLVEYTITYELNGGTNHADNPASYNKTTSTIYLKNPIRTGYAFTGWTLNGKRITYIEWGSTGDLVLVAGWSKIPYTVSFDGNGAESGSMETFEGSYQATMTVPDCAFARTGYAFTGWNTEADGSGTAYAPGDVISFDNASGVQIRLYAQWITSIRDISFDGNGAEDGTMSAVTILSGGTITIPEPAFARGGYAFTGWNTKADGTGTAYAPGDTLLFEDTPENGLTLYAQWEGKIYHITYVLNGGTNSANNPDTYQCGPYFSFYTASKRGYTFKGWYLDAGFTELFSMIPTNYYGDVTVYAKWQAQTGTLSFDGNGGSYTEYNYSSGAHTCITYYQEPITFGEPIPANRFSKGNDIFMGWNTRANGQGTWIYDQEPYLLTSGMYITLYAQWATGKYNISYQLDGGRNHGDNPTVYYGGFAAALYDPSRTGYTFGGWYLDAAFTGGPYTEIPATQSGAVTLYAKWKPNTYSLIFDGNGADSGSMAALTCEYDREYALPLNGFVRAGYAFLEWNTRADGTGKSYDDEQTVRNLLAEGTLTLYAQWEQGSFTVVFMGNGAGSGTMAPQSCSLTEPTALTANAFTRTGHTFTGWNTMADGTGTAYADGEEINGTSKLTLYAQWKRNSYTISFNKNGGAGTMEALTCSYGTAYTLTANTFTRKGYTFGGWNTKADGTGTAYADKASVKNLKTTDGAKVVLYAQWDIVTYKITYKLNSGKNNSGNPSTYQVTTPTITLLKPTRTGYTFAGWYKESTFETKETSIPKGSTGAKTFYAKWTANKYTITFLGNGATSGSMAVKTCSYPTTYTLPANQFKRTGYTFAGWNTKKDGSGTVYANKAKVSKLKTANGANINLYAQWTVNKYTITFNGNGATSGTMADKVCKYGTTYTLAANKFKRSGWTFTGWNTKANGSGKSYSNKDTVKSLSSKNGATVTLYAQWKPAKMTMESRKSACDENQLRFYEVEGVTGYEIYRCTTKTGTYSLLKRVTAAKIDSTTGFDMEYDTSGSTARKQYTYNDWSVKAGKTYYYKIRAYTLDANKNKVYGAFSTIHTVKTGLKPNFDGYMVNQDAYTDWCEMVIINKGTQAISIITQTNFRLSVKPNSVKWTSKARQIAPSTVSAKTTQTISIKLEEERLFLTSEPLTAAFYFWYDGCAYLAGVSKAGQATFRGQSWLVSWD